MKIPLSRFTVKGNSMLPTLRTGQDILVRCWLYKIKMGDIVVIKVNGKEMVKRIRQISHDRKVFVQGDNEKESTDSRSFGLLSKDQIVGKVVYAADKVDCLNCGSQMVGIYGRKDAICQNCGFKLTCCGEP